GMIVELEELGVHAPVLDVLDPFLPRGDARLLDGDIRDVDADDAPGAVGGHEVGVAAHAAAVLEGAASLRARPDQPLVERAALVDDAVEALRRRARVLGEDLVVRLALARVAILGCLNHGHDLASTS